MPQFLDHNVTDALAKVWQVTFGKVGEKELPVCRVFVELDDDPEIDGLEKTFFLTTEDAKAYFFKTLQEAFEWWGDVENLEQDQAYGGIVGKRCRVTTEKTVYKEKEYFKVQYINHIDGRKTGNDLLDGDDKKSFLAGLKADARNFEITQKAEGKIPPPATKAKPPFDDDITF